jgi:histidinol-phosphatase (PHP family)
MIRKAKKLGLVYLAITDHLDLDYLFCETSSERKLNIKKYHKSFQRASFLQTISSLKGVQLAFGVEVGYSQKSVSLYKEELPQYPFDIIINSVHTLNDIDLYHFLPKNQPAEKKEIFIDYLNAVYDSIDPGYEYDVLGHIGYVSRYVTYFKKNLLFDDTRDIIDMILKKAINLDKTIELNTNVKSLPQHTIPESAIIKRYRELGGENLTFGSDAHLLNRIGDGYENARQLALSCGFKYWTIYLKRIPKKILIN